MYRTLGIREILVALALALPVSTAHAAGGINLSWDDCGSFGSLQKNFTCNSNVPSFSIYGSAIAGVDMPQLEQQLSVMEMQTNTPALPPWWMISNNNCRPFGAGTDFDFRLKTGCLDPWGGPVPGGLSFEPQFDGPNRARIRTICAIPGGTSINGVDEYYFFRLSIQSSKTVGNGSCAGCTDGACIVLQQITLSQPAGVGDLVLTAPITRQHVQWQAGGGGIGDGGCPGATPTRGKSWGGLKSLYR